MSQRAIPLLRMAFDPVQVGRRGDEKVSSMAPRAEMRFPLEDAALRVFEYRRAGDEAEGDQAGASYKGTQRLAAINLAEARRKIG